MSLAVGLGYPSCEKPKEKFDKNRNNKTSFFMYILPHKNYIKIVTKSPISNKYTVIKLIKF